MDLIFYHTCNIPCPSSTSCHKIYHPHLYCCVYLSPHLLYWHIHVQTTIIWMQAFFVQLSCCICSEDVGFEDGTWVIGYLWWWSHYVDPPWIFCAGCHYILIARRKGSALPSLRVQILADLPCMSWNLVNLTLVPHIPEVLYVVKSPQWTRIHQHRFWSPHTTVDW